MSGLFTVVLLVTVAYLLYFFTKGKFTGKKIEHIVPVHPAAQATYNKKYQLPEKNFSLEEKIEMSWQFLADIRDYVINKFSKDDQTKLHEAGHKLHNHGMKYIHDVNDISRVNQTSKAISKEMNIAKGQSASR